MTRRFPAQPNAHTILELHQRDGDEAHICPWCERRMLSHWVRGAGVPFEAATIEHIVPIAEGGSWALSNLVLACRRCNNLRSKMCRG